MTWKRVITSGSNAELLSLTVDGDITAGSDVYANQFFGDGSELTGVATNQIQFAPTLSGSTDLTRAAYVGKWLPVDHTGSVNLLILEGEFLSGDVVTVEQVGTGRVFVGVDDDPPQSITGVTQTTGVGSVIQILCRGSEEFIGFGASVGGKFAEVFDTTLYTTTETAIIGQVLLVDCSAAARTVNPPVSKNQGDAFWVSDATANSETNNITIDFTTATDNLCGTSEDYIINIEGGFAGFMWVDSTTGWIPLNR